MQAKADQGRRIVNRGLEKETRIRPGGASTGWAMNANERVARKQYIVPDACCDHGECDHSQEEPLRKQFSDSIERLQLLPDCSLDA